MQPDAGAEIGRTRIKPRYKAAETVKSAVRALEILEFFDRWRCPAQIGVIATDLNYPQSSTSALVRSLVKAGYLTYSVYERTYFPTERVPLLGSWIGGSFLSDGPVLSVMNNISEHCGLTCVIGRRNGHMSQWVHVVSPKQRAYQELFSLPRELPRNAVGQVLLAAHDDAKVRALMHSLNAETGDLSLVIRPSSVVAKVNEIRLTGSAYSRFQNSGMLARAMPGGTDSDHALAMGIFGKADAIERDISDLKALMISELGTIKPGFTQTQRSRSAMT